MLGTVSEHRQVGHRAHAVGEIDRGKAVVDDVGPLAGIAFVAMVDVIAPEQWTRIDHAPLLV